MYSQSFPSTGSVFRNTPLHFLAVGMLSEDNMFPSRSQKEEKSAKCYERNNIDEDEEGGVMSAGLLCQKEW
jgi:hypothetical protein